MPATAPAPAAIASIAWWSGGTPWLRMPPPTRNIAAVPTIVSSFISIGAPARIARPTACESASARRLSASPPSSSLTIAATKP